MCNCQLCSWWLWGNPDTFVLPVPKGATFRAGVDNRFGTSAPTAFQWYPLARNATLTEVDLADASLPAADGPDPVRITRPSLRHHLDRIVGLFGEIAGDRFTPPLRERAVSALEALLGHHSPRR